MAAGALSELVAGALVMGYAVCGLFFLRFWRRTADRLFLVFAIAFWLLGAHYLALVLVEPASETNTGLYLVRLLAYLYLLIAIIDKNRSAGGPSPGSSS